MPSRDEMIKALRAQDQSVKQPSREEMVAALRAEDGKKKHGAGETAVMHGLQGATAGLHDEIAGLGEAAGRVVGVRGMGGSFSDVGVWPDGPTLDWETLRDAYRQARDKKRGVVKEMAAERPGLAATANVAGAVISPVNKVAQGASLAKSGAAIGAVTGFGNSEGETPKEMAFDTATGLAGGAIVGRAIDKAVPLAKKAVEKVGSKSKELAERLSARAIGAERGTIKKFGQDQVQSAGRQALDEGVLSPLANTDDKIVRNEAVKSMAMEARKAAYAKIDEAGASTFNPLEVASKVESKLLGSKNRSHDDVKELVEILEPHLANILSRGEGNIPMTEAQKLVEALGKKAKFDSSRSTQANEVAKQVYHTVRDAINESASTGAEKVGTKGLRKTIESANKTYARGKTASSMLENKQAAEQGNRFIGITDAVTGAGGLAYGGSTGDWETAAGVVAGKKVLQKYGAQNAALLLDKVSKKLLAAPSMAKLAEKNPTIVAAISSRIEGVKPRMLPAAERNEPVPELKGEDKWAVDGFAKLVDRETATFLKDPETAGKVFASPQGRRLLMLASDMRGDSKGLDRVLNDIKTKFGEGAK